MGILTNKRKATVVNCEKGQSVVEYVMLMAVVGVFITTLMSSTLMTDLLGPHSSFFDSMKRYFESTYQFGHYSANKNHDYSGGMHDTYNISPSESRFWTSKEKDQ